MTTERGRDATSPGELPPSGWKDIAVRVKDEFLEDHVTLTAAGVAFFGFVALIPLIIAGVSIYGLIADPAGVTALVDTMGSGVPAQASDLLEQQLLAVTDSSSTALGVGAVVGIAVALWTASSGFAHLIEALNIAYDETDGRTFVKKRALALAMTLGALVLFAAIGVVLALAGSSAMTGIASIAARIFGWLAIAAVITFGLTALYRYGPDRDEPKWRWASWGAGFALVATVVVSIGFSLYVANFASYNETYGSLGAIVVTLMWLYLVAIVVIVGAEINAEMEHQTLRDSTRGQAKPMGQRGAHVADSVGASTSEDRGDSAP